MWMRVIVLVESAKIFFSKWAKESNTNKIWPFSYYSPNKLTKNAKREIANTSPSPTLLCELNTTPPIVAKTLSFSIFLQNFKGFVQFSFWVFVSSISGAIFEMIGLPLFWESWYNLYNCEVIYSYGVFCVMLLNKDCNFLCSSIAFSQFLQLWGSLFLWGCLFLGLCNAIW